VTNDDGISSPGLHALAAAFAADGHHVIVVAPSEDYSGHGAALGPLHRTGRVAFERVEIDGLDVAAFAVDGPPALASMSACLGGFGPPPDLLVAGINVGANTGRAVLHSATVGAALTAANCGLPAIAVSQAVGEEEGRFHWATAATLAVASTTVAQSLRRGDIVNLNVPNVAPGDLAGIEAAELDAAGVVQSAMVEREAGVLELQFPRSTPPPEWTDTMLLRSGCATITMLSAPRATADRAGHREAVAAVRAAAGWSPATAWSDRQPA
jgi:5'-nucleotidase